MAEHRRGDGGGSTGGGARRRTSAPTPRPFVRKWSMYAPPPRADGSGAPAAVMTFRVLSFNVLADYIVQRDGPMEDREAAWKYEWSYRQGRLLREILHWQPDVICLQEVDHYEGFFEPRLKRHGYEGVYKKRSGEETHDGCAVFVKSQRLEIVASYPLEYFVPEHPVLDRHNIANQVVVALREEAHDAPPRRFVVANTHLLFNPGRGDVKLAQLQRLLSSLAELRTGQHASNPEEPLPVLLCGDFNLAPHSALYEFLSQGTLEVSGLSKHFLSGQNMDSRQRNAMFRRENDSRRHLGHGTAYGRFISDKANRRYLAHFPNETIAQHELPLVSAYAQLPTPTCTGEPKFTTFHEGTKATVDYIWFTRGGLHCHGVVEMVPAGILIRTESLPTAHHSSDHLSLVADFSLL